MVARPSHPDSADPGGPAARAGEDRGGAGYASEAYAAALPHLGRPVALARAGGWLLRRPIGTGEKEDLAGPYPLLCCSRWPELAEDLEGLVGFVSVTAVLDPLAGAAAQDLRRAFSDRLVPFKRHYLVDLEREFRAGRSSHHRRSVRRAREAVEVERAADPRDHAAEWRRLYSSLAERVGLEGAASDFPPASLDAQLAVPGMRYYRARIGGETVAASLWLRQGERIHYHLGASLPAGARAKASYALFDRALEEAAAESVRWAGLGGIAGLEDDPDDGLAFFKKGWSTDSAVAHLGGRVLDPAAYDELAGSSTSYFPAYRAQGRR